MHLPRETISKFLRAVEYSHDTPFFILATGEQAPDKKLRDMLRSNLLAMHKKRKDPLKRLKNEFGRIVYADPYSRRSSVAGNFFRHEIFGREAVAKFIYEVGIENLDFFSSKDIFIEKSAKMADYRLFNLYFEFDGGSMNEDQLKEKIQNNYAGKGEFVALFWMASRPHESEDTRLKKLLDISKEVLKDKPNRILGAKYSAFLKEPYFYNYKGRKFTCQDIRDNVLRTN